MNKFLVVCAANSFRSACGAAVLAKALMDRGHEPDVDSCGVIPLILEGNIKVSPYAIDLMDERGVDVRAHTPKHVSVVDMAQYDIIFTMDAELKHKLLMAGAPPERIVILNEANGAVPDPWPHGKEAEHAQCLVVIERAIADELTRFRL